MMTELRPPATSHRKRDTSDRLSMVTELRQGATISVGLDFTPSVRPDPRGGESSPTCGCVVRAVREKKETGKHRGKTTGSSNPCCRGKTKTRTRGGGTVSGVEDQSRGERARPAPPGRSGSRGTHTRGRHFSARSPLRIHRMSVRERSPRELARRRSRSAVNSAHRRLGKGA